MKKIAAVYCVYEDSGFLHESVRRIYPLMDKIVFLLNFKPWNGEGDGKYLHETYSKILKIFDPDKKIQTISSFWETEAEQRNFGLDHLYKNGIDWCFIIDDDEMYNYADLKNCIETKVLPSVDTAVFLSPHQIYWKTSNFCIDKIALALPSFCRTDSRKVYFNDARAVIVEGSNWYTFLPTELVCHHFSYVRNNEMMLRKIQNFSHADPSLKNWYEDVWLKWDLNSKSLHPNQDNKDSFHKAIPVTESPFQLEPFLVNKDFEESLQKVRTVSHQHLHWLKQSKSRFVEFLYCFVNQQLRINKRFSMYSDVSNVPFFTVCEAILRSEHINHCQVWHGDDKQRAHDTYGTFCTRNDAVDGMLFDLAIYVNNVLPKSRFVITKTLNFPHKHAFNFGEWYFVQTT